MNAPDNLKYNKSHEWVRIDGNIATVGITDFAQSELGDVVFLDLSAEVGYALNAGDVYGTIEAVKTVSDLYMPVAGKITGHNESLGDDPEKINNDPYGDGWMIKIEIADGADVSHLMDAEAYKEMVGG